MSRVTFKTGKPHQERAAIWARQRLADAGGRQFSSAGDQDGVLLADSVGMGKTWEAIAAAALILYKKDQPQRNRRHVLILCPSNLVTKWEDELVDRSPLRRKLDGWLQQLKHGGHAASAHRIHETLSMVYPIRRGTDLQTRKQRGRFSLPGGTYIVSQTLIGGRGHGMAALRRETWDIVIVDEAHSAHARNAIKEIEKGSGRAGTKILLTATPFQLDPRQWDGLATNIVRSGKKVMQSPPVALYVEELSAIFESPNSADPSPKLVAEAGDILSLLAARTVPRSSKRTYSVILLDGSEHALQSRLDALDDGSVQRLLAKLRDHNKHTRDQKFEAAYFRNRLNLALNSDRTFVANRLRHVLSQKVDGQRSPRLAALGRWAARVFEEDIEVAVETGIPEKTIVFSSLVGKDGGRDAETVRNTLEQAYESALATVRQKRGRSWDTLRARGAERLVKRATKEPSEISAALRALAKDELTAVLASKTTRGIVAGITARYQGIEPLKQQSQLHPKASLEARTLKRRISALRRSVTPWADGKPLRPVERYTGRENRTQRDRAATLFREIGPPWILVASNVGSEGIDLHTYTRRIVHYDLEWNPARMEQREGRGDRLGRKLRGVIEISYCLVPDTYDERMFYQLVARDRWHGLLLGKPATKLAKEDTDAPVLSRERLRKMRLDLRPR